MEQSLVIKVVVGKNDVRRLRGAKLADILEQLRELMPKHGILTYRDETGDAITVATDADVREALVCQVKMNPKAMVPKFEWTERDGQPGEARARPKAEPVPRAHLAQVTTIIDHECEIWLFDRGEMVHADLPGAVAGQSFIVNWVEDAKWSRIIQEALKAKHPAVPLSAVPQENLAQVTTHFDGRCDIWIVSRREMLSVDLPGVAPGQSFMVDWVNDKPWRNFIVKALEKRRVD